MLGEATIAQFSPVDWRFHVVQTHLHLAQHGKLQFAPPAANGAAITAQACKAVRSGANKIVNAARPVTQADALREPVFRTVR